MAAPGPLRSRGSGASGRAPPPSGGRCPVALAVVVVAVACLASLNSLRGTYVFDDIKSVLRNPDVMQLHTPPGTALANILSHDFWGRPIASATSHKSYRPLVVLSFRLTHALFGATEATAWVYHAGNVAAHGLVSLLVLCWARTAFPAREHGGTFAGAVALLFATHPVHVESVANITGRSDAFAAVFFLCTLLCFVRARTAPRLGMQIGWLALTLGSTFLGMLCKETAVTALGVCLAEDFLCRFQPLGIDGALGAAPRRHRTFSAGRFGALLVGTAGLLAWRLSLNGGSGPHLNVESNPAAFDDRPWVRIATLHWYAVLHLVLVFFPWDLCCDRSYNAVPLIEDPTDPRLAAVVGLYALGVLAVYGCARARRTSRTTLLYGLLLLVVPFVPSCNVFLRVGFVVAERGLYAPSIGACVLLAWALQRCGDVSPLLPGRLLCVVLALFAVRTVTRGEDWSTSESLYAAGLRSYPHSALFVCNFAISIAEQHHHEEAALLLQHGFEAGYISGGILGSAHRQLGRSLKALGQESAAEAAFRSAFAAIPYDWHNLLPLVEHLSATNRSQEAMGLLMDFNPVALNEFDRGQYLYAAHSIALQVQNPARAKVFLRSYLAMRPTLQSSWFRLAEIEYLLGNHRAALDNLQARPLCMWHALAWIYEILVLFSEHVQAEKLSAEQRAKLSRLRPALLAAAGGG